MPDDNPAPPRHALTKLTRPLCVIDSEWTGPSPADSRLVSLAIHKLLPGGAVEQREWFVNPEKPIDPGSGAVHGITDAQAAAWPPFRAVAAEVAAFLDGADIGGYGVSSDVQILELELEWAGCELRTEELRIIDPLRLWQKREPRKLTDAYERFVGPVPDTLRAHDAGDDARMTIAVIEAMAGAASVAELHAEGNPKMVDVAGKFIRDEQGRITFGFGKHRGDPVDAHPDFLDWMLGKNFTQSTLAVARAELHRMTEPPPEQEDGGTEGPVDDIPF
ncbi:MAG: 3'-5' exonuclease [Acidobacteria bacterium]|nr:3'-5' exonuclease [Acidobacteriota bacterium]